MKKIVQINVVCNGSTGKIMCDIAKSAENEGMKAYCFYGRGKPNKNLECVKIGNRFSIYLHAILARIGFNGHGSYFATKKLVKQLKLIKPDVIHLHNIHGYYINLKVLFKYLKNEYNGKIVWTLHDCWAFTGHCSHFTVVKCDKWKKQCKNCSQLRAYPKTIFDTSKYEYKLKKELFLGLLNLTIVTPSNWLKKLAAQSFLKNYHIDVINNGVDLNIFKPNYDFSVYNRYNIPNDKKIILGVASVWTDQKGLNTFLKLSKVISNDYVIVLVGLTKKQILKLPGNIVGIERTDNIYDLVKLYSIASVFVNPSLEETFSLVTVEAMACGLPVVVSGTSAIGELVIPGVGAVVANESIYHYLENINNLQFSKQKVLAHVQKYSLKKCMNEYLNIYK